MKNVFVLLSSLGSGGAERVAVGLANAWAQRSMQVTLMPTHSNFDGSSFYAIDERVNVRPLVEPGRTGRVGEKYWGFFARLYRLRRLLVRARADVVVAFLPNVNIATILATTGTGIPSVVGERSDPSIQPMGAFWRFACWALYRFANALTVQTSAVARKIPSTFGGVRRIEVMPNPLPAGLLAHEHRPDRDAQRRVLLSLGRLAPEKQVGQIIDVFSRLAVEHADWDLHVYGEGTLEAQLRDQVAALGLQERVSFKGPTRQPWLAMEDADLFVMNSRFEGFPNALLEAMGVGLPCVAADCPSGPREISREGQDALLFAPDDLDTMRRHLHTLMDDIAARERLGRQARTSVSQRYSLESVLARWDSLLSTVASQR